MPAYRFMDGILHLYYVFSTIFLVDVNLQVDYSQKQMFMERGKRMDNNYHETVNSYGAPEEQSAAQSFTQSNQFSRTQFTQPAQDPQNGHRGLAIASLVIGILSMTLLCFFGSIVGTVGLVLGIIALCKKQKPIGLSIAGIITSAIGLICGILLLVFLAGGSALAVKLRNAMYGDKHSTVPVPYETELPEEDPAYDGDTSEEDRAYDGEVTYPEKYGHYMGFYKDGIYEGVHMGSFNQVLLQEDK